VKILGKRKKEKTRERLGEKRRGENKNKSQERRFEGEEGKTTRIFII
jgi:hypothetical protein